MTSGRAARTAFGLLLLVFTGTGRGEAQARQAWAELEHFQAELAAVSDTGQLRRSERAFRGRRTKVTVRDLKTTIAKYLGEERMQRARGRHAAITRNLYTWSNYKNWAERAKSDWDEGGEK